MAQTYMPGGQSQPAPATTSMDLPPAIASLLDMTTIAPPAQETMRGIAGTSGATSFGSMPSYQMGGQVGPGGQPMPMATSNLVDADTGGPVTPTTRNISSRELYTQRLTQSVPLREMAAHEQYLLQNPSKLRSLDEYIQRQFTTERLPNHPLLPGYWPARAPAIRDFGPIQSVLPPYEAGGQVGPGGQPMPMMPPAQGAGLAQPGAAQQAMTPQQIQMEAQRFVQQNPQQVQQIQMAIQQGMQSGELTMEELNTLVQMATVALQNPAMYPQLRALAIREGLATEQDINPQFDPGILLTLVIIGQSLQAQGAAQPVPPQQMGVSPAQTGNLPSMATGGALPERARRKDGGIPIMAHEGEFVIPADVVRRKGTDFFEKMIQSDK